MPAPTKTISPLLFDEPATPYRESYTAPPSEAAPPLPPPPASAPPQASSPTATPAPRPVSPQSLSELLPAPPPPPASRPLPPTSRAPASLLYESLLPVDDDAPMPAPSAAAALVLSTSALTALPSQPQTQVPLPTTAPSSAPSMRKAVESEVRKAGEGETRKVAEGEPLSPARAETTSATPAVLTPIPLPALVAAPKRSLGAPEKVAAPAPTATPTTTPADASPSAPPPVLAATAPPPEAPKPSAPAIPALTGREPQPLDVPQAGAHLDLMIRQTRIHHMTLSISADTKANMLMIAASVVLSLAAREMSDAVRWHTVILTVGSLLAVCFAIFAAMPKFPLSVGQPPPSRNILFFGTFANLSYGQFLREMEEVMRTPAATYEMQLREIYEQGVYLKTMKYRFVQAGYSIFLLALFASACAWCLEALLGRS